MHQLYMSPLCSSGDSTILRRGLRAVCLLLVISLFKALSIYYYYACLQERALTAVASENLLNRLEAPCTVHDGWLIDRSTHWKESWA